MGTCKVRNSDNVPAMQRIRLAQTLVLAASLVTTADGAASLVRSMDLAELTRSAEQIVVADVLLVESAWDDSHRTIHSTIDIAVAECWKGSPPGDGRMRIRQLGGTVGEIEMTVHGMPRFSVGERALLFLEHSRVVGMNQGKRQLQWNTEKKEWQVAAPDRSPGVVMVGPSGRWPTPPETLDSLRSRVRSLLSR